MLFHIRTLLIAIILTYNYEQSIASSLNNMSLFPHNSGNDSSSHNLKLKAYEKTIRQALLNDNAHTIKALQDEYNIDFHVPLNKDNSTILHKAVALNKSNIVIYLTTNKLPEINPSQDQLQEKKPIQKTYFDTFSTHIKDSVKATQLFAQTVHDIATQATIININAQDIHGHTALHVAMILGRNQMIPYLIQAHANPNLQDLDGYTVLQTGMLHSSEATIKQLIRTYNEHNSHKTITGAPNNFNTRNNIGWDAINLAEHRKKDNEKIVQLLTLLQK